MLNELSPPYVVGNVHTSQRPNMCRTTGLQSNLCQFSYFLLFQIVKKDVSNTVASWLCISYLRRFTAESAHPPTHSAFPCSDPVSHNPSATRSETNAKQSRVRSK